MCFKSCLGGEGEEARVAGVLWCKTAGNVYKPVSLVDVV